MLADPRSAHIPFSMLNLHMQYAAKISLPDCFCSMGQRDRGFNTPQLFKDRPSDGTQRHAPLSSKYL